MNKQPRNLLGVAALSSLLALSLAAVGCGSDPDGSGNGGSGGKSGGGTGGTSGGMLGAITGMPFATFDTSAEGWTINTFADPSNLGGTGNPTAAMTTAEFSMTEGSPTPGSLKISAPFSDWNQNVDVHAAAFPMDMLKNWTGKKLHVRVKVASGFGTDMFAQGGAQPYILTGTSYKFASAWTNVATGSAWQEFVVDLSAYTGPDPDAADASKVIMVGLQLASGSGNASAAKPTAAVFYMDSVSLE